MLAENDEDYEGEEEVGSSVLQKVSDDLKSSKISLKLKNQMITDLWKLKKTTDEKMIVSKKKSKNKTSANDNQFKIQEYSDD